MGELRHCGPTYAQGEGNPTVQKLWWHCGVPSTLHQKDGDRRHLRPALEGPHSLLAEGLGILDTLAVFAKGVSTM